MQSGQFQTAHSCIPRLVASSCPFDRNTGMGCLELCLSAPIVPFAYLQGKPYLGCALKKLVPIVMIASQNLMAIPFNMPIHTQIWCHRYQGTNESTLRIKFCAQHQLYTIIFSAELKHPRQCSALETSKCLYNSTLVRWWQACNVSFSMLILRYLTIPMEDLCLMFCSKLVVGNYPTVLPFLGPFRLNRWVLQVVWLLHHIGVFLTGSQVSGYQTKQLKYLANYVAT